ncbi:MAG: tRNA 2-selenouridine(34) synthase MnmH [Coleofasciculaceae cyanobacterium]
MPRSPKYSKQPWTETYSEIIDVRSESEFAQDRIPGALNLPVLNDAERAKVGTIYKQVCPFEARKVGASLVAQNISRHLDSHFATKDKDYHPLVYCWRGGQRSNSMALVLSQIGWHVTILEDGYKTYRAYVREQLQRLPEHFTYQVLCGMTGSGKTHILQQLAQRGVQVLDLEGLAHHRGSLLGQEWEECGQNELVMERTTQTRETRKSLPSNQLLMTTPEWERGEDSQVCSSPQEGRLSSQPSQKWFESLLLQTLQRFDVSKSVWVEAESNKIGEVYLPPSLWQRMKQARCVEVQLPQAARVEWLLQEYPHFLTHPHLLKQKLARLKSRYGREKLNEWYSLIDAGQWHTLVGDLLTYHYDPAYMRSLNQSYVNVEQALQIPDLSDANINALLDSLVLLNCSAKT